MKSTRSGFAIAGILLGLLDEDPARAGDRYVAPYGTDVANDCATAAAPCHGVGYAVTQSVSGDTINLAKGHYRENLVLDSSIDLTILGGWIATFTSREPIASKTNLVAGKPDNILKDRVLTIVAGAGETITVTLDGLTLKGGRSESDLSVDVTHNVAAAGLAVMAEGGSVGLTATRTRITGNKGDRSGGLSLHALTGATVTAVFSDVELSANRAFDATAVRAENHEADNSPTDGVVDFSCTQCLFIKNKAIKSHSGTRVGNTVLARGATLNLVNTTVSGNQAGAYSAPFPLPSTVTVTDVTGTLRNTVVHGNTQFPYGNDGVKLTSSSVDIDHCDLAGTDGTYNDLGGNISAPPVLTRKGRIAVGSPLIDAGTCAGAPASDFDGDPRPTGAGCDIGADEFVP